MTTANKTGIHPLGHAVLVEAFEPERAVSLLVIPDEVRQQMRVLENRVRVLEIGLAAWEDEKAPRAKVGDIVLVVKHTGAVVTSPVNNRLYRLVSDRDIYCRLDIKEPKK